jgi:hypothetical protein
MLIGAGGVLADDSFPTLAARLAELFFTFRIAVLRVAQWVVKAFTNSGYWTLSSWRFRDLSRIESSSL